MLMLDGFSEDIRVVEICGRVIIWHSRASTISWHPKERGKVEREVYPYEFVHS